MLFDLDCATVKPELNLMSIKKYVSLGVFISLNLGLVQGADIRQGLVSYWPMDTTDGVTTPDVSPSAITST